MDQHQACMVIEDFVLQAVRTDPSRWEETLRPLLGSLSQAIGSSRVLQEHYALHRNLAALFCVLALCFPQYSFAALEHCSVADLNVLLKGICIEYRLTQRWEADEAYRVDQCFRSIEEYLGKVLRRYARTLLVRVDLHYQSHSRLPVTVERLISDKNRFLQGVQDHSLFQHCIGYLWRLEQGQSKGFHIHTLFCFRGDRVKSDYHKAHEIGAYWNELTQPLGYFYNCNAQPERYQYPVLGCLHRDALPQHAEGLTHLMAYFAKGDQRLRLYPPRTRSFGRGELS